MDQKNDYSGSPRTRAARWTKRSVSTTSGPTSFVRISTSIVQHFFVHAEIPKIDPSHPQESQEPRKQQKPERLVHRLHWGDSDGARDEELSSVKLSRGEGLLHTAGMSNISVLGEKGMPRRDTGDREDVHGKGSTTIKESMQIDMSVLDVHGNGSTKSKGSMQIDMSMFIKKYQQTQIAKASCKKHARIYTGPTLGEREIRRHPRDLAEQDVKM